MTISTRSSPSFIAGRSKAPPPASASASRSVGQSSGFTTAKPGPSACLPAGRRFASHCRWKPLPLLHPSPRRAREMTDPRPSILVVEDEPEIRRFLRAAFDAEGYRVIESATGRRGSIDAGTHKPDLAIVDLALPDIDGTEVIKRIREWSPMPIIVLSARVQEQSKIQALDAGANDYVTKPFGVGELLARVRVALRQAVRPATGTLRLTFGDTVVDLEQRTARRGEEDVHLTPIEFRLLAALAR